jgi:hypothetical protein
VHTGLPSFTTQEPFAQNTAAHASMQTGLPSSTWHVPPFGQSTPLQASPPPVPATGVVVKGFDPLGVPSSVPHPIPSPAANMKTKSILFILSAPFLVMNRRRHRGDVVGRLESRQRVMFTRDWFSWGIC